MQKTILQVPMNKKLKDDAEKAAYEQGFSSLQEILRVFMTKLAGNKIHLAMSEDIVQLSEKSEKRYLRQTKNFKNRKNVFVASDVEDLMKQLNEPL